MVQETSIGGRERAFPDTRWTIIASSRHGPDARRRALEELLAAYWKPLYFYVRRKGLGVEDSKDAIQGFFAHLLDRDFLERLDPKKGRLRSYLRASIDHFLANRHEASSALKRGGAAKTVSLSFDVDESEAPSSSASPEAAFDREWALAVMERALAHLRAEFESGERGGPFELVRRFFDLTGEPPSYEDAARESGMSVPGLKAFLHRGRVRFRELVRAEVKDTLADADPDAEVDELIRALRP
jgi:DNA-directed RNA polymerase specialized sigma24 family protein